MTCLVEFLVDLRYVFLSSQVSTSTFSLHALAWVSLLLLSSIEYNTARNSRSYGVKTYKTLQYPRLMLIGSLLLLSDVGALLLTASHVLYCVACIMLCYVLYRTVIYANRIELKPSRI